MALSKKNTKLSIIAPCYNEESNITIFYKRIIKVIKKLKINSYQIIFVDDGSKDNTWLKINEIYIKDKKMRLS